MAFSVFPKRLSILAILVRLAIVLLTLPYTTPAWGVDPAPNATQLDQVQKQIESHQEMIEDSQIKALNLEQELNRIDSEIKKGQETLRELENNLGRLEGFIQHKEGEIATIQHQKEAIAEHIKKRLAAFYQTGEVGIVNALFSATDLGELLNLQEYVQALFQYDQKVLQGYREQITLLNKAKEELTAAKAELQGLISQVQDGETALLKSRKERDALLAQARTEQELYRQALKELEAAAAKLIQTINQARALEIRNTKKNSTGQQPMSARTGSPSTKFAAHRGQLQPPAPGQIIRVFGPYKDQFGNQLHADGIDLSLAPDTDVTAMYGGRVIFADLMPGYGQLVIIDHGEQYYSLVSGLAALDVKKDEDVSTGDIIGLFGKSTGLVNPGLHLEIRHGSTPVDPLLWLDSSHLEFTSEQAPEDK